jgi:hypothetical protein
MDGKPRKTRILAKSACDLTNVLLSNMFQVRQVRTSIVKTFFPVVTLVSIAMVAASVAGAEEIRFEKRPLTPRFFCEGAHVGDFNRDGKRDVVSGPFWYAGPEFEKRKTVGGSSRHRWRAIPNGNVMHFNSRLKAELKCMPTTSTGMATTM